MFDKELHKEYVFLSYLIKILPAERVDMIDLEGKLKLEYYKLQETFKGAIELEEAPGVHEQAKGRGAASPEEKKPLDEIIEKINEQYKGDFTDADKVMLTLLREHLLGNVKLRKNAKNSDPKIFIESIFPKIFEATAVECYENANESFSTLFEDQARYKAIMRALAGILYREFRKK